MTNYTPQFVLESDNVGPIPTEGSSTSAPISSSVSTAASSSASETASETTTGTETSETSSATTGMCYCPDYNRSETNILCAQDLPTAELPELLPLPRATVIFRPPSRRHPTPVLVLVRLPWSACSVLLHSVHWLCKLEAWVEREVKR